MDIILIPMNPIEIKKRSRYIFIHPGGVMQSGRGLAAVENLC